MKKIILTAINKYKDGGSYSLKGSDGKEYWQNNHFRSPDKGTIFEGNINNKNPKKAKGIFIIDLTLWYNFVQKANKSVLSKTEYPRQITIDQS